MNIMLFYSIIQMKLFRQKTLVEFHRAVCMIPLGEQPAFEKTAFKSEVLNTILYVTFLMYCLTLLTFTAFYTEFLFCELEKKLCFMHG